MSQAVEVLKEIENLDISELAEALEFNGYEECVGAIRTKSISGQDFLKLTELQISLWRLPPVHARRLWSFIQQIRADPSQFMINNKKNTLKTCKLKAFYNSKPYIPQNKPVKVPINQVQRSSQVNKQNEMGDTEANSSTLSKQQSKELINKLELVLKKESIEIPNSSFIHTRRQPKLPPKPQHLISSNPERKEESPEDYNDGYLSPINKRRSDTQTNENIMNSSGNIAKSDSFLHKFRKNYENLEIRPKVIENKYEEQVVRPPQSLFQGRPLPPIPRHYVPNIDHEVNDEDELADYAPILEEDNDADKNKSKIPNIARTESQKTNSFTHLLPKVTQESLNSIQDENNKNDDEELPEYTSVIEEEEIEESFTQTPKLYKHHRPLPPIPIHSPPITTNERPPLGIPPEERSIDKSTKIVTSVTPKSSTVEALKPHLALPKSPKILPKSLNNLPKPPICLPMPSIEISSILSTDKELPNANFNPSIPSPVHLESPEKVAEESEDSFYTEIDLASLPSYREINRQGARRLLLGLDDGAFLVRPSRQPEYVCTLSIMTTSRMYNLGIAKKPDDTFVFGSVEQDLQQPKLHSIEEIINYYSRNSLYLSGKYISLKDILPRSRH